MTDALDLMTARRQFYDPLYEVVVFSMPESAGRPWNWEREDSVTSQQFLSVVDTYEVGRLNFLRQSALAWLVFPSATHTRFAHALGCWLLSDWAADGIYVSEQRRIPGPKEDGERRSLTRLRQRLNDFDWLAEFQLALLLHDVGHLPFSHVLEQNEDLRRKYPEQNETLGIALNHESIGVQLILGENPTCELYHKYVHDRLGGHIDDSLFLANCLSDIATVDARKVAHLLAPETVPLSNEGDDSLRLMRGVHELVSGVVDLDRLDHYHRDSVATAIRPGEFNVRGLLHNMALICDGHRKAYGVQLVGDGVDHAFQMLYAQTSLRRSVFHHEQNLAYEIMLNEAINSHWMTDDPDFRKYLPFLDDIELLGRLEHSVNARARALVQRIKMRRPYSCAGRFYLPESSSNTLAGKNKIERRASFLKRFQDQQKIQALGCDDIFLRLDEHFGETSDHGDWMDLSRILDQDAAPLSEAKDHAKFIDFLRQRHALSARTFWLFTSDQQDDMITAAQVLAKTIGAESF